MLGFVYFLFLFIWFSSCFGPLCVTSLTVNVVSHLLGAVPVLFVFLVPRVWPFTSKNAQFFDVFRRCVSFHPATAMRSALRPCPRLSGFVLGGAFIRPRGMQPFAWDFWQCDWAPKNVLIGIWGPTCNDQHWFQRDTSEYPLQVIGPWASSSLVTSARRWCEECLKLLLLAFLPVCSCSKSLGVWLGVNSYTNCFRIKPLFRTCWMPMGGYTLYISDERKNTKYYCISQKKRAWSRSKE